MRVGVRSSVYLVVAELDKSGFLLLEQVRGLSFAVATRSVRAASPVPGVSIETEESLYRPITIAVAFLST